MADDLRSVVDLEMEGKFAGTLVSSTAEEELKQEIEGKGLGSFSYGSEDGVKMNGQGSGEISEGRSKINGIGDLGSQEKEEILRKESDFIERSGGFCSDLKENEEMGIGDGKEMKNKVLSEGQGSGKEVFQVKSVFSDDSSVVVLVVEKQETLENCPKSSSQSQHLFETSVNTSRRSVESLDWVPDFKESQNFGKNHGEGVSDSSANNGILKIFSQIRDGQGVLENPARNSWEDVQKSYTSEVKEMEGTCLKNHEAPITMMGSVSKPGNGCVRNESGPKALGKKRSGTCSESVKQEVFKKKEKYPKKNGKGLNKFSEVNMLSLLTEARNACQKKADGSKRRYSRSEMEALRFMNGDVQRKLWREVYTGLGSVVARELNGMLDLKYRNHSRMNADHSQQGGKNKQNAPILGEDYSQDVEHNLDGYMSGVNMENNLIRSEVDNDIDVDEECDEDEDSDEEYDGIQKRAFYVEGAPDFDSGPPQDGLEYLRRVRWEAAQIPKVKVAKLDKSKVNEQTVYMPKIPDISPCPVHLQPTKQWEDAFLADFSELRQVLSRYELSSLQSPSTQHVALPVADDDSSNPTVSLVLGMDSVSRSSMLRKCISSFETKNSLSRNECLWLFALCAAVDTPLDADMGASLRCLLRKSASLRAAKSEFDDEVVMLNMVVTISGRFFGQLE